MALNPPSPPHSLFGKKKSSASLKSAASYLSAVSQIDAFQRARGHTPATTPALSLSSSVTASSADTILHEVEEDDNEDGLSRPFVPPTSEQSFTTIHSEFGHCSNERYRHVSEWIPGQNLDHEEIEPPYYILLTTYCSYLLMIMFGHLADFMGKRFYPEAYRHLMPYNVG